MLHDIAPIVVLVVSGIVAGCQFWVMYKQSQLELRLKDWAEGKFERVTEAHHRMDKRVARLEALKSRA